MSLSFSISPASDVPIFRQVIQQIQRAVALKRLEVGAQLPAVRVLAESLVINSNTVARAYQELIREGVLESRVGVGVFVAARRQIFSEEEQLRRLRHAAEQLCHEAMLREIPLSKACSILEETWETLQQPKPRKKNL